MKHELGRVIAERALILEADQALEKVFVRLGEPQASPEGDFYCAFDIERGADKDRQAIYGVDPFRLSGFRCAI